VVLAEDGSSIQGGYSAYITHTFFDPVVIEIAVSAEGLYGALAHSHGDLTCVGVGVCDES